MNIHIKTIPHKEQRYDTCGDWWFDKKGDLQITVSDLGNWKYEAAIAYHELREALMCKALGIDEDSVTAFDTDFENARAVGDCSEPGDQVDAPYYLSHQFASRDEMALVYDLGENWEDYNNELENL